MSEPRRDAGLSEVAADVLVGLVQDGAQPDIEHPWASKVIAPGHSRARANAVLGLLEGRVLLARVRSTGGRTRAIILTEAGWTAGVERARRRRKQLATAPIQYVRLRGSAAAGATATVLAEAFEGEQPA